MLSPQLMQQLGWAPPQLGAPMPVAPAAPVDPQIAPTEPPATPGVQLPAPLPVPEPELQPVFSGAPQEPQPAGLAESSQADYPVPASAIGGPPAPDPRNTNIRVSAPVPVERPGGPLRLPDPGRKLADAEQAQLQANQAKQDANQVSTQIDTLKAQENLKALDAYKTEIDSIRAKESEWNETAAKTRVAKQGALTSIQKERDDYKVDTGKYWKDLGMGSQVGWLVAIAMSSLSDQMRGGGAGINPVVQMLREKAQQGINMQLDQRDQLDKKLGRASSELDKWNAFSRDRGAQFLAQKAEADRELSRMFAQTAVKFAAPEAQAKGLEIAAKLNDEAAKGFAAAADRAVDYDMRQQGLNIQRGHLSLAMREEQRKQAEARAGERVFSPEELKAINTVDGRSLPVPPVPMTQKQYDAWIGTQKTGEQFLSAARENSPEDRIRVLSVPGVVSNTGKPLLARDKEVATKLSGTKAAGDKLIGATDELIALIKKNGHEVDFLKSPEWLRARATYFDTMIQAKELDKLGAITGPDMAVLKGQIGTDDPTEFRDIVPGIETFRHRTVENVNAELRNHLVVPPGERVARWEPVDPNKLPPPAQTQEQINLEVVLGKRPDPGATYNPDLRRWEPNLPGLNNPNAQRARREALAGGAAAPFDPGARATAAESAAPYQERGTDAVSRKYPDIGGGTRALLESTWLQLGSTDPTVRANAKAFLDEAARNSSVDDVSDYAKELLKKKPKWDQVETPGRSLAPAPTSLPPQVLQRIGIGAR